MRERLYITYARRAAAKVREVNQTLNGAACPLEGGALGDIYYGMAALAGACLASVTGMREGSDELNDMVTKLMFAEEDQIDSVIEKYSGAVKA